MFKQSVIIPFGQIGLILNRLFHSAAIDLEISPERYSITYGLFSPESCTICHEKRHMLCPAASQPGARFVSPLFSYRTQNFTFNSLYLDSKHIPQML